MPEFIEELISVSRIGRSMGIHLILATQKPSASVSGEIWSNARFHICLRVQTREDSMEMLHHPDAAFIKGMGSGFAQVGNDEIFEQIQTSYSGAVYDPEALPQGARPHLLDERGAFVQFVRAEGKDRAMKPRGSQMDAVLKEICAVAHEHTSLRIRGQLWRDELPEMLRMDAVEAALSSRRRKLSHAVSSCHLGCWTTSPDRNSPPPASTFAKRPSWPLSAALPVARQRFCRRSYTASAATIAPMKSRFARSLLAARSSKSYPATQT